jgi:hypothetical protein
MQSLLVWTERIWNFFLFGLFLTKGGHDFAQFAHYGPSPSPIAHGAIFLISKAKKKKNLTFS